MKCILLCAGYATRLFPLTKNFPKPLLKVGDRPIIDYIIDEVNTIDEIDKIYIITNDRYFEHFENWKNLKDNEKEIEVVNDNTTSNDDRLGAIGDMRFVIKNKNVDDDLMVIAGDNLFEFKLKNMMNFYKNKKAPCVAAQYIEDLNLLKRFGVGKIDENNKLLNIVEKPEVPESNIGVWATYIYPKSILPYFDKYFEDGNKADSPGNFVQYLHKKEDVYLYMFDEACYDVGTYETLEEVHNLYVKRNNKI